MTERPMKAWETSWAQDAMREEAAMLPSHEYHFPGHDAEPIGEIIYLVDRNGMCRPVDALLVTTEHWRVADAKHGGQVDGHCSNEILSAFARRGIKSFCEVKVVPVGTEEFHITDERYARGTPGIERDIFDVMTEQALRSGAEAPFSKREVDRGRAYRALHERIETAGMKSSSMFDDSPRGQGMIDFMDVYMRDRQALVWFHDAIGDGVAKDIKRQVRTSSGDRVRQTKRITVRQLVDQVCLGQKALDDVLRAHGWATGQKNRKPLTRALRAALARM